MIRTPRAADSAAAAELAAEATSPRLIAATDDSRWSGL